MPTLKFVSANAGENLNKAKGLKSNFQRSRFNANLELIVVPTIDDSNWVVSEEHKNDEDAHLFPVLHLTTTDGQRFDDVFLKTLVSDVTDANADTVEINGTFNTLCKQQFALATSDEIALRSIVTALAGRHIVVNRDTKYTGKYGTLRALKFDIKA